jgi:NAD(P)H-hydrate epimerase
MRLTRQQVRQIDAAAIERLGVSGLVLMENAGRGAADAICRFCGGWHGGRRLPPCGGNVPDNGGVAGRRIAVAAGAGNNGGDGFVIARHLSMRGAIVTTFLAGPDEKLTGDARTNLGILRHLGHDVQAVGEIATFGRRLRAFDVIIDALGGTGIEGPLRGDLAKIVEQVNASRRPIVAVDIPTGLDCDTGTASEPTIRANITVTFVAVKVGFDSPGAKAYTGEVVVADIGVPVEEFGVARA